MNNFKFHEQVYVKNNYKKIEKLTIIKNFKIKILSFSLYDILNLSPSNTINVILILIYY